MWDHKPLCRGEMQFIKHREDFVALADEQEGGWFDAIVENALGYLPRRVAQVRSLLISVVSNTAVEKKCLIGDPGSIHPSGSTQEE